MFALDFETALIQPGLQAPPPVCLSVASESGAGAKDPRLPAYARIYKDNWRDPLMCLLQDTELIVGANTGFDMAVAAAAEPDLIPAIFRAYDADRITDVIIRAKLIDIALGEYRHHGPYSLQRLAKRMLDRELAKEDTWRLRYWELIDVPLEKWPADAKQYSLDDALATRDVYLAQEEDLAEVGRLCVLADQFRQSRADFALTLASAWGLRTDREGIEQLRTACETRIAALQDELLAEGLLRETKKGISRCVRKAQARMLDINPRARLTKKGIELGKREVKYISVDAEACEDSGDLILEHYTEYSQLGNLLSGHVAAVEKGIELPLHSHFEVLLETGRTSSSKPNVQNVRRAPGARECYVPRSGWVYIDCDFDKAELHTLAQVCINLFGRSVLGDALNAGYDPHIGLGARLANTTYADLKAQIAAGDETAASWRQRAKPGNFGFPGGMGPNGMRRYAKSAYGVILSDNEAVRLYDGWQDQWPVIAFEYLNWIRQLTSATGYTTIEHFGSHRWRGKVPYCTAANSFFQGMSADGMKAALWEVSKKCYIAGTALYGCRVVNEVHDEIIVEAPEDQAPEAAIEMQDTMVQAYNTYTPDVPVKASAVLMDRWSKKAKRIVGVDGRLQVWRYQG
jgi:DNA polymerase I-like protein with 3'-5' exonuclease and polymerase domains